MRFRPWPRPTSYDDTPRKRAALARKQRLQCDKHPLLAELIAEQQPSADDEMARRAERWALSQQADRDRRARLWRDSRARLTAYDPSLRRLLIELWRGCPYPADPSYLLDLLHSVDKGSIDPARPPWAYVQPLTPRITANPVAFDDAFKQIGRRELGGGPKATEADEFIFIGNLSGELLILTSRVQLIDPNASFYTSSNHRLRDSHVGRAGHWIDIEVKGRCSNAELQVIHDLAQTANSRPVVVRRHGSKDPQDSDPHPKSNSA